VKWYCDSLTASRFGVCRHLFEGNAYDRNVSQGAGRLCFARRQWLTLMGFGGPCPTIESKSGVALSSFEITSSLGVNVDHTLHRIYGKLFKVASNAKGMLQADACGAGLHSLLYLESQQNNHTAWDRFLAARQNTMQ
jgi:hypothetical protein